MSAAIATAMSTSIPSHTVLSNGEPAAGVARRPSPDASGSLLSPNTVVNDEKSKNNMDPLPSDLRRIVLEVARSGQCSWLPWNGNGVVNQKETVPEAGGGKMPFTQLCTATKRSNRHVLSQRRTPTPKSSSQYNPRSSSPLHSGAPPRKKRRNGLYNMSRRRFDGTATVASSGGTVVTGTTQRSKRPLFLIRTTSSNSNSMFSTGSVGSSGRTSGSEPEDSTQYECDSEGTSATTNSELSFDRREQQLRNSNNRIVRAGAVTSGSAVQLKNTPSSGGARPVQYKSLREAIRAALGLVLDHSYQHRGGYKLSPAEIRRNKAAVEQENQEASQEKDGPRTEKSENNAKEIPKKLEDSAAAIFLKRRNRLLSLLGGGPSGVNEAPASNQKINGNSKGTVENRETRTSSAKVLGTSLRAGNILDGPPFTIQRVAEVLAAPERYYTQTHKLCNCLEKLLLVTSSSGAFGGSAGGYSSQSRQEERELAALAEEKGRERRLKRRPSASSDDLANIEAAIASKIASSDSAGSGDEAKKRAGPLSPVKHLVEQIGAADGAHATSHGPGSREYLEAAARVSLRSKFDHVTMDAHVASASAERDSGGRPASPPPPTQTMALQERFVRQHLQEHAGETFSDPLNHNHHLVARPPSPILFSSEAGPTTPTTANPLSPNSSMHLLQIHHAQALATLSGTPLDLVIDPLRTAHAPTPASIAAAALLEAEPGRSSASNSDVDSESDDISLDDSASDRSDGSDSGSGTAHYEPFTAARVMALNRMQQQQQRLQSRATVTAGSTQTLTHGTTEGFRPPADSEYQSGDSIDSMMAEDSGGSDSSSSDLAD